MQLSTSFFQNVNKVLTGGEKAQKAVLEVEKTAQKIEKDAERTAKKAEKTAEPKAP